MFSNACQIKCFYVEGLLTGENKREISINMVMTNAWISHILHCLLIVRLLFLFLTDTEAKYHLHRTEEIC